MRPTFLGVDVGTTRVKAVVLDAAAAAEGDASGGVIASAALATPQGEAGGVPVHSPDAIRRAVVEVAGRALAQAGPECRRRLAGIAVASVGEEAVLVDAVGNPVADVPTWFSGVGARYATEQAAALDDAAPIAGLRHPEYTVHTLAWWAGQHRERSRAARTMTDLGSWVLSTLGSGGLGSGGLATGRLATGRLATGRSGSPALVMDHSHASRTGLFDPLSRTWRPQALAVVGMPHLTLPTLVPSGTVIGSLDAGLADTWGVPAGVALVSGGHDHFCAAWAAGARGDGEVFISAGTSEAHLLLARELDRDAVAGREVGCFVGNELLYLHAALPSGTLFLTLTAMLNLDPATPLDELLADEPTGSRGLQVHLEPGRRMSLSGITTGATPATVVRAFLEATAQASVGLVRDLASVAGGDVRARLIAGTPADSRTWREIRTEIGLGPASFVAPVEVSALGAAQLAAAAVTGVVPPPVPRRSPDPARSPTRRSG